MELNLSSGQGPSVVRVPVAYITTFFQLLWLSFTLRGLAVTLLILFICFSALNRECSLAAYMLGMLKALGRLDKVKLEALV